MQKKTADIKVRVDPLTKSVLVQIADREALDLSDVVRRALRDFVSKQPPPAPPEHAPVYGNR